MQKTNVFLIIGLIVVSILVALNNRFVPGVLPPDGMRRPDPAAPARNNRARIWMAVSGDTVSLDGVTTKLKGVVCPPPETEDGRDAKALLNTYLRAGYAECRMSIGFTGQTAICTVNAKNINDAMSNSAYCD